MRMSVSNLSSILILAAALLVEACSTLPAQPERAPTLALKPTPDSNLVQIAERTRPAPELTGFRLMPLGSYALDTRVELARRAQHSLDVQYYLIANDMTGRLLMRSLRDAALRGVRVRLLVDDLYTIGGDEMFRTFAAFDNVEVRLFNPFCCSRQSVVTKYVASLTEFGRLNHRMHNKLFIADGAIAVAGGRNIADEYFMRSMTDNFVDMDVAIVGDVVPKLATIFDTFWNSRHVYPVQTIIATDESSEALRRRFDRIVDEGDQMMAIDLPPVDILGYTPLRNDLDAGRLRLAWGKAAVFADSPEKVAATSDEMARSMSVTMSVTDLIWKARDTVMISSPYFIPGEMGVTEFGKLNARDVKITIITNSLASNDEPVVHTGYARYRAALLKAGVDLYELNVTRFQHDKHLMFPGASLGRLHAKTAVIDASIVFIGSMNLDPRSASKNTELGIIAESPDLAKDVIRMFHIAKLQNAYRLRFGPDGNSLQWLAMEDNREVVLAEEPDTTPWTRLQNMLLAPFVPEQQL